MGECLENDKIASGVRRWVESVVVGLNLCPFAMRELLNNRVRFAVTPADSEEQLLMALESELILLEGNSAIETTLLIHPQVLQDFEEYNQFLDLADLLLFQMDFEGVYQVASFHPNYQFSGTQADDAENYTNRSPYPMCHLIREDSLERAIASYPDIDQVPTRNIALMNSLGQNRLRSLLQACVQGDDSSDDLDR